MLLSFTPEPPEPPKPTVPFSCDVFGLLLGPMVLAGPEPFELWHRMYRRGNELKAVCIWCGLTVDREISLKAEFDLFTVVVDNEAQLRFSLDYNYRFALPCARAITPFRRLLYAKQKGMS